MSDPLTGIPANGLVWRSASTLPSKPGDPSEIAALNAKLEMHEDPAARARYQNTKVDTVLRKNGQIVGVIWADGISETPGSGSADTKSKIMEEGAAKGWSMQQINKAYANELARELGPGVTIDNYTDEPSAPTRAQVGGGMLWGGRPANDIANRMRFGLLA
jgi:hypothetical protein